MSRVINVQAVDSKKLKEIFEQRGLSCAQVAKDMGHAQKYISNKLAHPIGKLCGGDITFLERIYSIHFEDYKYVPPTRAEKKSSEPKPEAKVAQMISPVKVTNPVTVQVDKDAMYQLIYSAMYEAVKAALNA